MKLKKARITNFQSIHDSSEFEVGEVTCLVGKNEAGKTALLKALYRMNPIRTTDSEFDATNDYPRQNLVDYDRAIESGDQDPAQVVEALYELESPEISEIRNTYGNLSIREDSPTVVVRKGYSNKTTFSDLNLDTEAALSHLVSTADLPSSIEEALGPAKTVQDAMQVLEQGESSDTSQRFLQRLQGIPDGDILKAVCEHVLLPCLPQFLYFDEFYQLKGQDNLNALRQRRDNDALEESDEPLLGLIELAGLDLDQLISPDRTESLIARLEAAENQLTNKVLRYWSQNRHLRMKFDIRSALPHDPPGMTDGMNILGRVQDTKHMVSTPLGTRSRGFIWFFSFLAWYSRLREGAGKVILLLDEPGLSLHAKAQEDLLRYFEEELKPHHQLIYTTHSPFMVDAKHFDRVRIVQDLSIEQDVRELHDENQGTKVITEVLDATADSLFPLQGALGYEIHQTLFVGPNCLIVEGVSDLLYIQTMSAFLETRSRVGLSAEWTVTPVGGATNVPTFVALIGAQTDLNVAVLLDTQSGSGQKIENLYRRKLLKKQNVLTYADFTKINEADVEDMFDTSLYLKLVNNEFGWNIQMGDLADDQPRIVRRIEGYLGRSANPGGPRFNHFRPARYFNENVMALAEHLSDGALDRFESAFRKLNELLR